MERVLFAPVGDTDPVRNCYDGPVLHIVRHYRPDVVYLYLTERFEPGDIFEDCVKRLHPSCKVERIFSGIADPSDFDLLAADFSNRLDEIAQRHKNSEIILNISSGTPQMIASLCLEAVNGKYKALPVQVKTPKKGSNAGTGHDSRDTNVDVIFDCLLDQLPGEENRCVEPGIIGFRKALIRAELISLISAYDYTAASRLLRLNEKFFPGEIRLAVEHAVHRMALKKKSAEKIAKELQEFTKFELYPVKNTDAKKIIEYYLVVDIKQHTGELTEFVLRLTPLLTELMRCFMDRFYRLDQHRIMESRNNIYRYTRSSLASIDPGLPGWLDQCFGGLGSFQEKFFDLANSIHICSYFTDHRGSHAGETHIKLLREFEFFREIERNIRNNVAHKMVEVDEETLKSHAVGLGSKDLSAKVKNMIKDLFGNEVKEEAFLVYEKINRYIIGIA